MRLGARQFIAPLLVLLLALVGIACAQSGEIYPDAVATERNLPTATAVIDVSGTAEFQIGDEVRIVGGSAGFLVPLYGEPGARFFSSQINSGELAIVQEHGLDEDGNIWFLVEGLAGSGWLTVDHLALPSDE